MAERKKKKKKTKPKFQLGRFLWKARVINASLTTTMFSADWKIAEVSPILKEGDFEEAGNNRPISLLPILSKVCEKAALNQLMPYLAANKRLAVTQSGNKK